jgi:hypothetical protein
MKELFVLAWHSYDQISTISEGDVVGVFESLAEAQYAMNDNIEETVGFYENEDYTLQKFDKSITFSTLNGYTITYHIAITGDSNEPT